MDEIYPCFKEAKYTNIQNGIHSLRLQRVMHPKLHWDERKGQLGKFAKRYDLELKIIW